MMSDLNVAFVADSALACLHYLIEITGSDE
jgi:hypothetical protein